MIKPLILVVDDEKELTNAIVQTITETERYDVLGVYSAEEALEALEKHKSFMGLGRNRIRCIVLDIKMPGMSGLEMLEILRKRFKENIGVILLTAWEDKEKWDKAVEGFVAGYITKPFERDNLINTIDRYFQGGDEQLILETFEKHLKKEKEYKEGKD